MTKEPYRCSHRKGIAWTAVFVGGTAFVVTCLAWCNRPAGGAPRNRAVEIAPGMRVRAFCPSFDGQQLTPRFERVGAGAVVSCSDNGGQIRRRERLRCANPAAHAVLVEAGNDPGLGPYFTVDCVR